MSATTELAPSAAPGELNKDTYKGKIHPDWCPGCGDFSVLSALQAALFELGLQPHQVLTISGIGCSSNLPGFINTYGMHTLHGRALAVATGAKLGNHELKVIATGGDGDGFGIGGNHFMHTMRRNVDLTYIAYDQIYGLTTGQTSLTSRKGMKTKSTLFGNVENPYQPDSARHHCGRDLRSARVQRQTKSILSRSSRARTQHKGFSFIDVFSPKVIHNKDNTYQFFQFARKSLGGDGHDPSDFASS